MDLPEFRSEEWEKLAEEIGHNLEPEVVSVHPLVDKEWMEFQVLFKDANSDLYFAYDYWLSRLDSDRQRNYDSVHGCVTIKDIPSYEECTFRMEVVHRSGKNNEIFERGYRFLVDNAYIIEMKNALRYGLRAKSEAQSIDHDGDCLKEVC